MDAMYRQNITQLINEMEARWLKPSEVTEPGAYWLTHGEKWKPHVIDIRAGFLGDLAASGIVLSQWPDDARLLGPITPPEYTGDWYGRPRP